MNNAFILDACAVIAFLSKEEGSDKLRDLLSRARQKEIRIFMHNLNLLEVYYGLYRTYGEVPANTRINLMKHLPLVFVSEISGPMFNEAGRLKARYKMSLADAVLVAEASILGAAVVTSDHHELDAIDKKENIDFYWFR
jgi:predicted nucleic acid-binding protein